MLNLISAVPTQSMPFDIHFGAALVVALTAVAGVGIVLQLLRQVATSDRSATRTLRPVASH